jgi:hypothetical protein
MFVRGGGITPATAKLGHVSTSQSSLWSGQWGALDDPLHCDLPLLNGFHPYQSPCGTCKLRIASPNSCIAVVAALGFRIMSILSLEGPFIGLFTMVCQRALVLATHPRRCNTLPVVIFLDLLLLPLVLCFTHSYWSTWMTPHVCFLWAGDTDLGAPCGQGLSPQSAPSPPSGWSARSVTLMHCAAGGEDVRPVAARGMVPSVMGGACPCPPRPSPLVPHSNLGRGSGCRSARPWGACSGQLAPGGCSCETSGCSLTTAPWHIRPNRGQCRAPVGSFPGLRPLHAGPSLCGGQCFGWYARSRGQSWRCYGMSQFLVSDRLFVDTDLKLLEGFCTSAPAKILFEGADVLLTTSFRGGFQEFPEEERVGPAPKTDDELGFAVGVGDAPPSLAAQVQVIKGDTQKADSAHVPDHLWVYAFLCGYGPGAHGPRHL